MRDFPSGGHGEGSESRTPGAKKDSPRGEACPRRLGEAPRERSGSRGAHLLILALELAQELLHVHFRAAGESRLDFRRRKSSRHLVPVVPEKELVGAGKDRG